jgi:hypothetical protein
MPWPKPCTMIEAATHAMTETTGGVRETYTMIKSVGHAVAEIAVASVRETCTMVEAATHSVAEFTVSAIVGTIAAIRHISVVAVVVGGVGVISAIGVIGFARQATAVSRIVYEPGRTGILAGVGLRSSRLRSSKASHGQPNAANQQCRLNREFAAGHRSLLLGICPTV